MESRAKLLGHPIHQMLVVLPLGMLVSAAVMDVLAKFTNRKDFAAAAYWNMTGGLVSGMVAAVFGLVDWLAIPSGTRAKRIGLWHASGNLLVTALFGTSWLLRKDGPSAVPDNRHLALELAATAVGGVSAWLGGELVDRLGVGVDEGAHLDSPNSLFGQPAYLDAGTGADGADAPGGQEHAAEEPAAASLPAARG